MKQHEHRRDEGMTLIELLISSLILGIIVSVLAAAVIVTFRQGPDTRARLDIARWEQGLALWLPADLSSASDVSDDQTEAPCASASCTFGVNALQLSWTDGAVTTKVSYRYGPASDGESWQLNRVVCEGASCSSYVVLRDLLPPTDGDGNLVPWSPGDALADHILDEVIDVTIPLEASSTSVTIDPADAAKTTARRVIVNVNGLPGPDGVNRGSAVSFTAGGTSLSGLEPVTYSGPEFVDASSGCGGPVTLIVDKSGSIGSDMGAVRDGVRGFVQAFDGTPTRLQIVTMATRADVLGAGSDWNKFYDLSEPSDVEALIGPSGTSGLVSSISAGGWTNWEDAMFRTFYAKDGTPYKEAGNPAAPEPELVVFFTDGLPTRDRLQSRDGSSDSPPSAPAASVSLHSKYRSTSSDGISPRGWYRAEKIADLFRGDSRLIGLGVGSGITGTTKPGGWRRRVDNEAFLGLHVTGLKLPHRYRSSNPGFVEVKYNGGWGDVSGADLLTATNYTQFAQALTQIALDECGGTLTVQTRDGAGNNADADVTYTVGSEQVTTTRLSKSRTFEVDLAGIPSKTVDLLPQPLAGTGYAAQDWNCRAGGSDLARGTQYDLIVPGDAQSGIWVNVTANQAVSCTLEVSP